MKVPADRAERSEVFILKGLLDIGGLIAEEAEGGGHPCSSRAESRGNANGTTTAMGLKTGRVKPR